jgi:hypothetical protein
MGIAASSKQRKPLSDRFKQFFDPDLSKVSAKKRIDRAMALIEAEISSNSHSANRV